MNSLEGVTLLRGLDGRVQHKADVVKASTVPNGTICGVQLRCGTFLAWPAPVPISAGWRKCRRCHW